MVEFSSSPYTLQENKTIDGKFIESGELESNGRYFSHKISHSSFYATQREGNTKTAISTRSVIKIDISVSKIKSIKELNPCLKTMKQEEL